VSSALNKVLSKNGTLLTVSDSIDDLQMNSHAKAAILFMNRKSLLKIAYSNIAINNL